MTREEALQRLKNTDACDSELCKALEMAIKALEQEPCEISQGLVKDSQGFSQEPCENAVSRQAVMDGLISIAKTKAKSDAQKSLMGRVMFFVEKLPPVTPQPKMGRWQWNFHCSLCHNIGERYYDYCPGCGAKMQEVEE